MVEKKIPWYVAGLHFECMQCGRCCSGPAEGNIWVNRPEIQLIADFLKIEPRQLRQKYLRRRGLRTTIIEEPVTKNCIFLQEVDGRKRCMIYPVRPNQCRTWPFWSDNLANPNLWNMAAGRCPGINRGRCYSLEEIEKIKKQKDWWSDDKQHSAIKKVAKVYNWLDLQIRNNADLAGHCNVCGECCDFGTSAGSERRFDHRLFITTPELMYLTANLGVKNMKPMTNSRCPYNINGKCTIYEYRFAGCRIFCCKADSDFQSKLSETALKKFKSICTEFQIPYRYTDLVSALNSSLD